jgi:hypothetical protein
MEVTLIVVVIIAASLIIGFYTYKNEPKKIVFEPQKTSKPTVIPSAYYTGCTPMSGGQPTGAVIDLNLAVNSDDTVAEESPIRIVSAESSYFGKKEGDYALRVLDAGGKEIWCYLFTLYYDYEGPVVLGEDYSKIKYTQADLSLRIPYTKEMKTLNLWHKGKLIFGKNLQ